MATTLRPARVSCLHPRRGSPRVMSSPASGDRAPAKPRHPIDPGGLARLTLLHAVWPWTGWVESDPGSLPALRDLGHAGSSPTRRGHATDSDVCRVSLDLVR